VWCGSVSYPGAVVCVCGVVVYPILELLCVWCGSVSYPRAAVFVLCYLTTIFPYALPLLKLHAQPIVTTIISLLYQY
jgi:hypothetical protein